MLNFLGDFEQYYGPLRVFHSLTFRTIASAVCAALIGFLMISDLATYSWSSLHISKSWRLPALLLVAMAGAALFNAPWHTLSFLMLFYLATIPFSVLSYHRIRRRRAATVEVPNAADERP